MTNAMNRRAALGSLFAAGAAFAVPVAAAATSNPDAHLFELIEDGKRWWDQIGVYCTRCDTVAARRDGREVRAGDEEKLDEAHDGFNEVLEQVAEFVPTSIAGIRAKLEWMDREAEDNILEHAITRSLITSLMASPILAT